MGIVRKIITYALIGIMGASIGTFSTKCSIERRYELIPKSTLERKVEQETEYVNSSNQSQKNQGYTFQLDYVCK